MKCELCRKNDAETAVETMQDGEMRELYVCRGCAAGLQQAPSAPEESAAPGIPSATVSITQIGGDGQPPPPFVEALMEAVGGLFGRGGKGREQDKRAGAKFRALPNPLPEGSPFRMRKGLHLEGLNLTGYLDCVRRACRVLGMELRGIPADGIDEAGHVYTLRYRGSAERARRFAAEVVRQESLARDRLQQSIPIVFLDAVARSIAVLRNCRLLSPAEAFDMLSPLRLAALAGIVDGIALHQIENAMAHADLSSSEDNLDGEECDRLDAERAVEYNRMFARVKINARGEELSS